MRYAALIELPARPARALLGLIRPLDEFYLTRSLPVPDYAHIRRMLSVE